jgi:protein TonB
VPGTSDVYLANPGAGIVPPKPTNSPKPGYTPEAMRRRIQGGVSLQCVVNTDGRCEDIKVVASLDSVYGLDEQAIQAAGEWRFTPGTLNGKPVKVRMNIDFSFNLR